MSTDVNQVGVAPFLLFKIFFIILPFQVFLLYKYYVIFFVILFRLIKREEEIELEEAMTTKRDDSSMVPVEEDVKRQVCAMLKHITSLHSPCQMLDGLVAAMKILASTADENNHCKSL